MSSKFNRNVLTLATGVSIGQAIPIVISPVLTRLYTPEDFGILALFLSISTLVSVIASGRYEQAIMLPEDQTEALQLSIISWIIAVLTCSIMLLSIIVFHDQVMGLIRNNALKIYIYFTPLLTLSLATFNIQNVLATRLKAFSTLANVSVLKSIVSGSIQLAAGFYRSHPSGLISGQILGSISQNASLFLKLKNSIKTLSVPNWHTTKALLKRYIRFPQYSVAAVLSNTLTQNILNISVSSIFTIQLLGFYSFANRILILPMNFLGNSIGQVFFQEATREKNESGSSLKTLKATFWKLLVISLTGFGILHLFVEEMFTFVFGADWALAGLLAKHLIPMITAKFIVSPLSAINNIYNKQYISLIWQVGYLVLTVTGLSIVFIYDLEFTKFVSVYALAMMVYYFLMLPFLFIHARGDTSRGKDADHA